MKMTMMVKPLQSLGLIDLELDKEVDRPQAKVGEEVTFTISVTNKGPSSATNLVVEDKLPSGFEFVSANIEFPLYNQFSGFWNIGTLEADETAVLEITAKLLDTGDYGNVAEVYDYNERDIDSSPNNDDGDQSEDDEDGASVTPLQSIDLELNKSVDITNPEIGDIIAFTISLVNKGASRATGVVVTDKLPSGYTYVSHEVTEGSYNASTGVWNVGTVIVGNTEFLTIRASVNASGDFKNIAEVAAANEEDEDSEPGNDDGDQSEDDEDSASITPQSAIDLELTKVVDNLTPFVGEAITFTITLTNKGPDEATNVVVSEVVPDGYTYQGSNDADYNQALGIWTIDNLGVGETRTLRITVTVNPTGEYLNQAEVLSVDQSDLDSSPGNGVDTDGDGIFINDPGDEDDGDAASINPRCQLGASLISVDCDDNGTPSNPNDDQFTFSVVIQAFQGSNSWIASTGATGSYGELVEFGPYPISGGAAFISFTDVGDNSCSTSISVDPPNTCSDQCDILAQLIQSPVCNDNGTPVNPNDDTYTFVVTVNGVNTGGNWIASDGSIGTYGEPFSFGPYPINEESLTIDFFDSGDNSCVSSITVAAPEECSDQCLIIPARISTDCDDNGTPFDPSDDRFSVTVLIEGTNTSGTWRASNGVTGQYGQSKLLGIFPISGGSINMEIVDGSDSGCKTSIFADAPPPCPQCELILEVTNVTCQDNGTPFDPSDDVFTFDVVVTGNNASEIGWRQQLRDGSFDKEGLYDEVVTFGPYPIADGTVDIRLRDKTDSGCFVDFSVDPPAACSATCRMDVAIGDIVCDDSGTPNDPSDDTFRVVVTVTGEGVGTIGWIADDPNATEGEYGIFKIFGPYLISDGDLVFNIYDKEVFGCNTQIEIPAPEPCSPECLVTAEVTNIVCDNNGTPANPTDDTFTFEVTTDGFNNSGSWVSTDPNQTTGDIGTTTVFGPYPISGGDLSFQIRDLLDANCAVDISVEAPETCSEQCEVIATVTNILCDDNGTFTDPDDDTFTFELTVTGFNNSNGWIASDGSVGQYNETKVFGPYPIDVSTVALNITDLETTTCFASVLVDAPETCSNAECDISATMVSLNCISNDPNDPFDDEFTVDIHVSGTSIGTGWVAFDPLGTTGNYNETVTFGPYPMSFGGLVFTIADNLENKCNTEITIEAPELVVECPEPDGDDGFVFATEPDECAATINVPLPVVEENCSDYTVTTEIVNAAGEVIATIYPDVSSQNDEDDHDPEGIIVNPFDLALVKSLAKGQDSLVVQGDTVNYTIAVTNQGLIAADSILITDYFPASAMEFDPTLNPGWTILESGKVQYLFTRADDHLTVNGLITYDTVKVDLSLVIKPTVDDNQQLVNEAEISRATNLLGQVPVDVDSQADTLANNDAGGVAGGETDDAVNGDGSGAVDLDDARYDEDDHDPAEVFVNPFDLASYMVLDDEQSHLVTKGETVDYVIKVFNQGLVAADNILLTNYIPEGMTFIEIDNPGWTLFQGDKAQLFLSENNGLLPDGGLVSLDSVYATLKLRVNANVPMNTDLTSQIEISGATDILGNAVEDIDSRMDEEQGNDAGGHPKRGYE